MRHVRDLTAQRGNKPGKRRVDGTVFDEDLSPFAWYSGVMEEGEADTG
mgnify:CR=1